MVFDALKDIQLLRSREVVTQLLDSTLSCQEVLQSTARQYYAGFYTVYQIPIDILFL
jgi:hypothetical protein